ncbi:NEUM protein, partial [Amia calva]|nr:NEUM protein [Amia calva]
MDCHLLLIQVEKNEEADQKIEQDGNKPEDKAHKAATKIQASFRGHIIRKKLKDEKKVDGPEAATAEGEETKGEKASSPAVENKEPAADATTEPSSANSEAKSEEAEKAATTPAATTPADPAASESSKEEDNENKEEPAAKESATTTSASTESAQSPNAVETAEKEEPKQADVPAADSSETPKAQSEETDCNQPQDNKGEGLSQYPVGIIYSKVLASSCNNSLRPYCV